MHKDVKKHLKLGLEEVLLFLAGIALLFFVLNHVGFYKLWAALKTMNMVYLPLIFTLYLFAVFIWNYKWLLIVRKIKKIRFMQLFPITLVGGLVNNLTPGPSVGGEPVKAYFLSKLTGKELSKTLATVIMDSVIHMIAFASFVIFSIAYVMLFVKVPIVTNALIILILLGICGIVAIYSLARGHGSKKRVDRLLRWVYNLKFLKIIRKRFPTYEDFKHYLTLQFKKFMRTLKKVGKDKKLLGGVGFYSVVVHLLEYIAFYLVFIGLGYEISFIYVLVVSTVAGLIGYYVFLPGGIGALEASSIAMYTSLGVDIGIATAATLIGRILFYIINYGFGAIALVYVSLKYKETKASF